jgi:hypothetical protein
VSDNPFAVLEEAVAAGGPEAAFDKLAEVLQAGKKYPQLFEALLMKKRHALGLPILGTDSLLDLPEHLQAEVEDYYVEACRRVGGLYLEDGDIAGAWPYFRAIDEAKKVAAALDRWVPPAVESGDEKASAQLEAIVDIALHQAAHPRRGFELVLAQYGVCRAITTYEHQFPVGGAAKEECGVLLVKRLHADLLASLKHDIAQREGSAPGEADIRKLIEERAWLFQGFGYHVDVSHLQSVIRIAAGLKDREALAFALELTEYGRRLPRDFQHPDRPPFTDFYSDYRIFFQALLGTGVDGAVRYFTMKVESQGQDEEARRFPAEVLVYLLYRVGRYREAIEAHRKYLKNAQGPASIAPSLLELCDRAGDHSQLLAASRERDDLLHYMAGLVRHAGPRTAD